MLRKKLSLMRRLAYVPWLLAVGLVLGWSGEAVADTVDRSSGGPHEDLPENHNHSDVPRHMHATDPYMEVSYGLLSGTAGTVDDTISVSWITSSSKNLHNNDPEATPVGNGAEATTYIIATYSRMRFLANPSSVTYSGCSNTNFYQQIWHPRSHLYWSRS